MLNGSENEDGLVKQVSNLEETINDAETGLIKQVSDLDDTLNHAEHGLIKKTEDNTKAIDDIEDTLSGTESEDGLIKQVSDIDHRVTDVETEVNNVKDFLQGDGENTTGLVAVVGAIAETVTDIKDTLHDEENGLIKQVSDIDDTLNHAENGLVRKVSDLDEAINDAETGLVKNVSDIDEAINDDENGLAKRIANNTSNIDDIKDTLNGTESEDGLIKQVKNFIDSKNNPDGIAGLDNKGKLPLQLIPDDYKVIEVQSFSELPPEGKEKTIYITRNDNRMYRWDVTKVAYTSLSSGSGGGDGGVTIGLYSFDVDDEGYLCLYYEDGTTPPNMFIDADGYLWVDIKGNEDDTGGQGEEPVSPIVVDYARFADLPETGEVNTIYHIVSTNKYYIWNKTSYSLYNSGA
jgi:hypothetical protein